MDVHKTGLPRAYLKIDKIGNGQVFIANSLQSFFSLALD